MELATILEQARLHLDLDWVPKDENAEADDLSNGIVKDFDPVVRVEVDVASME